MATAPPHPSTRPFNDLVLDFLAYLELERGLSRNTLEAYRTDLQQFGTWLAEHDLAALEVGHNQLADFIAQLGSGEKGGGRPAARRSQPSGPPSSAAGRGSSGTAPKRGCSSTRAGAGSRGRGSTRRSSVTPRAPAWPGR